MMLIWHSPQLESALLEFATAFDVDPAIISGIIAIAKKDFDGIVRFGLQAAR